MNTKYKTSDIGCRAVLLRRFILFLTIASFAPFAASAQSLILKAPKTAYRVGESFQVSLSVNTAGQAINTISGKISLPPQFFEVREVRYGSSILSLWVERPRVDKTSGSIAFSGGVPGGFAGSAGPVLSVVAKTKRPGSADISVSDIKVLLNDGLGTEVPGVSASPLRFTITEPLPVPPAPKKAPSPVIEEEPVEEEPVPAPDIVPPEEFVPLVSRHPTVGDNAYFVSFFAVDKNTGISHYEVSESPYLVGRFMKKFDLRSDTLQNPPYILRYQHLPTGVTVRAYDQAGNIREGFAEKPASLLVILIASGIFALLVGIGSYFYAKRGRIKIRRKIYDIKP